MRKLLTFCDIDSLFANAGQAVVERLTLRNLVHSGWAIRAVASGNESGLRRLEGFCRDEIGTEAIEIVPCPPADSARLLDGISLIYLHSLLSWEQSRWLLGENIWLSRPTLQFVHAFGLTLAEQIAWGALWGPWRGSPPCRLVAPSKITAERIGSISGMATIYGGRLPRVEVVPHGVDEELLSGGNRQQTRASLHCTEESHVILSLARLSPEKLAYRQIVTAFQMLKRWRPERDFRLVMAGGIAPQDQQSMAALRDFAMQGQPAGTVVIEEHVSEERKRDLFAAADLFGSPSCHPQESFGLALLEAMAAGLPIVASDWNGYREVMPEEYHPYLVPTIADHESARNLEYCRLSDACAVDFSRFAEILDRLVTDRPLAERLIEAGRRQARTLSWRRSTGRIVEIMDLLIQEFSEGKKETDKGMRTPPMCSPVAGLATTYLSEDLLLRRSGITAEMPDAPFSPVEDLVWRALGDRPEVRLADLGDPFRGDTLLRNRVVMQLLRSGLLTVGR